MSKCHDTVCYLGQLCAYMAGPGVSKSNEVDGATLEYRLAALLSEPYGMSFEEGQRSVHDRYSARSDQIDTLASAARRARS